MNNIAIAKFPVPTLPGWRHHYDMYYYAGWRIQRNEVHDTYRVLSPTGSVYKTENKEEALAVIEQRKSASVSPKNNHLVIIVPGLNNLLFTFSSIEKGLKDHGYETLLWDFASNRADTKQHAKRLYDLIDNLEGIEKISFVAHSLGGLIIRAMLAEDHDWHERFELGHIVNIASPHRGSFIADLVSNQPDFKGLFDWVCGHVGHDLTSEGANKLPPVKFPIGVIIGGTGSVLGLNPLAGQDNDIVVSRESAEIELAADCVQVKGSHTLMLWSNETVNQTAYFLKHGCFLHNTK